MGAPVTAVNSSAVESKSGNKSKKLCTICDKKHKCTIIEVINKHIILKILPETAGWIYQ